MGFMSWIWLSRTVALIGAELSTRVESTGTLVAQAFVEIAV
jgi:uncharacterized BrkB/YihY/UPF0761 family membrane protein